MEKSTGKRGTFLKNRVTNSREVAQLAWTLKQKVQAKAHRIKRYDKKETQFIKNKMFKQDNKKFYRNLAMKNTETRDTSSMEGVKPYCKSL